MTEDTRQDFFDGLLDALNRHDLDAVMEFYADDCVWDMPQGPDPWGRRLVGKAEVRDAIATRFANIANVQWADDHNWICGDKVVSEFRVMGTNESEERWELKGCDLLEIKEGRIVRKDTYWKMREEQEAT